MALSPLSREVVVAHYYCEGPEGAGKCHEDLDDARAAIVREMFKKLEAAGGDSHRILQVANAMGRAAEMYSGDSVDIGSSTYMIEEHAGSYCKDLAKDQW
jgi:hypothetical protein